MLFIICIILAIVLACAMFKLNEQEHDLAGYRKVFNESIEREQSLIKRNEELYQELNR